MSQMIRTILTLGSIVSAVLVPLFFGHALAAHAPRFGLYALAALVIAVVLGVAVVRGAGRTESRSRT